MCSVGEEKREKNRGEGGKEGEKKKEGRKGAA
jgi:hypothetical protein